MKQLVWDVAKAAWETREIGQEEPLRCPGCGKLTSSRFWYDDGGGQLVCYYCAGLPVDPVERDFAILRVQKLLEETP